MRSLRLAVFASSLLVSSSAVAADWLPAGVRASGATDVMAQARAVTAVDVSLRGELRVAGGTVIRLTQRHGGLPVFGRALAVKLVGGRVSTSVGAPVEGLTVDVTPSITAATATALANASLGRPGADADADLGVLPSSRGGRLVYRVSTSALGGFVVDVDAVTGAVLMRRPTQLHAQGRVYAISSDVTPKPVDLTLVNLDIDSPQHLIGFQDGVSVFEYASTNQDGSYKVTQTVEADVDGNFLFDPPKNPLDKKDPFAAVNAFFHIGRARSFYSDVLGVDMSSGKWPLAVVVNVLEGGDTMDNAAFSPQQLASKSGKKNTIIIGQGSQSDFAYDSDVFIHEFQHYMAHNAIGYGQGQLGFDEYGYNPFTGAIDEGTADYFACTINGDSTLGEASLGPLDAERDLSENGRRCLDDLSGEVHEDGKLIGNLTWRVRELLGRERADAVVWGALTLLTESSSLGDFAKAITATVGDLVADSKATQAEADAVAKLIADRGLDDCDRVLSIDGKRRDVATLGLSYIGSLFGANCPQVIDYGFALTLPFQFSLAPTTPYYKVSVSVPGGPTGKGKALLLVRKGQKVTFDQGMMGELTPAKFDASIDIATAKSVTLGTPESGLVLEPGATYFAAVFHQTCGFQSTWSVQGESVTEPGSAGAGGTGGSASGGSAGRAGSAARAGVGGKAGASAPAAIPVEVTGGCDCAASGADGSTTGILGLGLGALALFGLRRSATASRARR